MLGNKIVNRIIIILMICLSIITVIFTYNYNSDSSVSFSYENKIFDTSDIIELSIDIDEDDWNDLLANPLDETYYSCDVTINGYTLYNVGIRTKGNTSLSTIANDDSTQRYSFKLEFDHYIEGQTYYGLDKLILNNNYADATNMKEALIYDMFAYLGVDATLYNYAKININDSYWGVYLALEGVEESFLMRNYGVNYGYLYKPESEMGGGNHDDNQPSMDNKPDNNDIPYNITPPDFTDGENDSTTQSDNMSDFTPDFSDFSFTNSNNYNGADLNYSDDNLDSYSAIWDGEVNDSSKKDHKRVIEALKNISEETNVETYLDIDNIVKYMAVHVFSVNDDSLSGSMAHNYYLYEKDGMLNIIPWDYNLAFGGFMGNNATSVINSSIDDAFDITDFFDCIYDNDEYKQQYYQALQTLIDEYVNGGGFDQFYQRVTSQIDSLVETDPNAFYTYEEYETAKQTLYQVVKLRAQSVDNQLNGSGETVDASSINLNDMGSMNTGGPNNDNNDFNLFNNDFNAEGLENFDIEDIDISEMEKPEMNSNFNSGQPGQRPSSFNGPPNDNSQEESDENTQKSEQTTQDSNEQSNDINDLPIASRQDQSEHIDEQFSQDYISSFSISNYKNELLLIGGSLLAIIVAIIFIKIRYKR